jgi:hypothetical protein
MSFSCTGTDGPCTSVLEFPRPEKRFAWAGDFAEGFAPVALGDKYGFIDTTGALRVEARFDGAGAFACDRAPVLLGGKWGYLDATGVVAIDPAYAWAGPFREGLAAVADDSGFIFIDSAGRAVGPHRFTDARPYSEGMAAVRFGDAENCAWGFIDRMGMLAIPPSFTEAPWGFSEGKALVRIETERPWRAGFIDTSGGFAIDTLYDAAGDFHEGLAPVGRGEWRGLRFEGKWGYVDSGGRPVIPLEFATAGPFRGGRALVRLEQGGYALIGRDGRVRTAFRRDLEIAAGQDGPLVTYTLRGRRGLLDTGAGEVTGPVFAEAWPLRQGWSRVRLAGMGREAWAYIGRDGTYLGSTTHVASP